MSDDILLTEILGKVGLIRFNRPQVHHALNDAVMNALTAALDGFEADDGIHCVVLTGSDKAFAAGADIAEMRHMDYLDAYQSNFITRNWERLKTFRKPVIAAVSGVALGGGCEVAMMCDMIFAADTARFALPEVKIGAMPGAGGTQRLPRAVGKAKAMDLCLTGRMMDAAEAERCGLVSRVLPAGEVLDAALSVAHAMAEHSLPVLLFQSIVRSPVDIGAASGLIGAGLLSGLAGIALAYSLPYWPWLGKRIDARDHAASAQVAFRFNSFIGLALAERLAGAQGLLLIAVLIGVCVPLFNVAAVWPMARHGQHGFARELLRNPLIIATASGLVANLLGFRIPEWLEPTVSRISAASLALGLMAAGAGMQFGLLTRSKTLSTAVLAIRHLAQPLIAFATAQLFALNPVQTTVLLAFSALPTASTCYVLAARMGYNGPYVAGLVTLSTLLGMVSLPFALGVLGG